MHSVTFHLIRSKSTLINFFSREIRALCIHCNRAQTHREHLAKFIFFDSEDYRLSSSVGFQTFFTTKQSKLWAQLLKNLYILQYLASLRLI